MRRGFRGTWAADLAEREPVVQRRGTQLRPDLLPQAQWRAEAGLAGNGLDRHVRGVQQLLCAGHALCVQRLEDHTYELQSLMRLAYAVFCLKKKRDQWRERMKYKTSNKNQ